MIKRSLYTLLLILCGIMVYAQSPCDVGGIHPFCTDDNPMGISYASGTSGSAQSFLGTGGPGCLGSTPAPAWYYMRIANPGNLLIYIEQYSGSTGRDVDFICWGPFQAADGMDFVAKLCNGTYNLGTSGGSTHRPTNGNHQNDLGGYPVGNIVDCSYSGSETEWCYIPNAQAGDYYILLLTNYSQQPATISFNRVDAPYAQATTDCSILQQIEDNQPVCEGGMLELIYGDGSAQSGVNYKWLGPNNFQQTTTTPTLTRQPADDSMNGVYKLVLSQGSRSDTVYSNEIEIQPKPTFNFFPADGSTICQGETVAIGATVTNYDYAFFSWNGGAFNQMPHLSDTLSANFLLDHDTCFRLVVSTSSMQGEGCSRRDTLCINVPQTSSGLIEDHICVGQSYNNYDFTLPVQNVAGDTLLQHITPNESGCDSVTTVKLSRTLNPDIHLAHLKHENCDKQNGELIVEVLDGVGPIEYTWTPTMAGTDSLLNIHGNTYTLNVVDSLGCTDTKQYVVNNIPTPTACFNLQPPSYSQTLGEAITFVNCTQSEGPAFTSQWDMGNNYSTTETNPTYTYPNEGKYMITLTVTDTAGCTDQTMREIEVHESMKFYIPNAFTPNGDGVNETFGPFGVGIDPDNYSMNIFDRNGNLVYMTTNPFDYWDGYTKNGVLCPTGVYVYKIVLKTWDGYDKEYVGTVTLAR